KRVEDERRVAQPSEAIVPVARAADLFGERSGRRGDERARRLVRQKLERERAAADVLTVRPFVTARVPPTLPVAKRAPQLFIAFGARRARGFAARVLEVVERDPRAFP